MRDRILLIGTKFDDDDVLARPAALAIDVALFQRKHLLTQRQVESAEETFAFDYVASPALIPLARALHAARPFTAVLSMTEAGLIPAATLNDALDLGGTSLATVTLLQHKTRMRERLAECGLSPVRARECGSVVEADAFAAACGYHAIAKPVNGGASVGIGAIASAADVAPAIAQLEALGFPRYLLEEYLDGPEFSVEAFSFAGRHVVVAITAKRTGAGFVELAHTIPAPLDEGATAAIEELVVAFLDAVGLRDGPSHTELKLTPRGPRIIESHNRIGGDHINDLVRAVYGIDLVELTVAWPCNQVTPLAGRPRARGAAAVAFVAPSAGEVVEVTSVEMLRTQPDVMAADWSLQRGERVEPLRDNGSRRGYVIVRADDAADALGRALRYADTACRTTARSAVRTR